jgi:plasmid stability protein
MISLRRVRSVAQLLVRNLEDDVKARLRRRADRNGQSTEEVVRDILRNAVKTEEGAVTRLGSRLRDRFSGIGLDEDIGAMRGHKARAASFRR